jgi:hypothetical protein
MANKKNKTLIWIGAAALIYFLLRKKKTTTTQSRLKDNSNILPSQKFDRIKRNVDNLEVNPIIDENDYFKTLYKQSQNNCTY